MNDASRSDARALQRGSQIVVLVDYDGTIAEIDVSDELVKTFDEPAFQRVDSAYRRDEIGSRAVLQKHAKVLPSNPADLPDFVIHPPHDKTFVPFIEFARQNGVAVEVVSDGLGFFVAPALRGLSIDDLPIYSAALDFGGDLPRLTFPHGNPLCAVCGTCKRDPVLRHQRAGRHVVFVGDGHSDRYAAAYADTVFAKGELAELCVEQGIDHVEWQSFVDITAGLARLLSSDQVPPPIGKPYICGPEKEEVKDR